MVGIIDVGGGLRGIFGAGVFDYCIDNNINFEYFIGISAGAANILSFLAGQKKRNYTFYTEYAFRKQYMSLGNFLRHGSYIDMNYIYGTLTNSNGEYPLDYEAFSKTDSIVKIAAVDALTGNVKYFDRNDLNNDSYEPLKATCSIPVVCKPHFINNVPYYDGGIGDPIPLKQAFDDGCDKVVLILTKPRDTIRIAKKDATPVKMLKHKYPLAAEKLANRYKSYNDGVAWAKELEKQGKVIIIAPDDICGLDTLSKDKASIDKMYQKGYIEAEKIKEFLK